MTIKDRVGQQQEGQDMVGGKGGYQLYWFFQGETDPSISFINILFQPGAYAGYHRHERHDTILYVLSGVAEHYQEGDLTTLNPGDAVLVRSGNAHAVKNIGDEDLRIIEFFAALTSEDLPSSPVASLPLPEAISDW